MAAVAAHIHAQFLHIICDDIFPIHVCQCRLSLFLKLIYARLSFSFRCLFFQNENRKKEFFFSLFSKEKERAMKIELRMKGKKNREEEKNSFSIKS